MIRPTLAALRFLARHLLIGLALVLVGRPAFGSSVEVRCGRLLAPARAELMARARLLLIGAGMGTARVGVNCDASTAWLVWIDGTATTIDEASGVVEGALDALENRIHLVKDTRRGESSRVANVSATLSPAPVTDTSRVQFPEQGQSSPRRSSERHLEGGVSLGTTFEFWSQSPIIGPRLEAGLGVGKGLAFVIGEGARFGVGPGDAGHTMVFDLRAGVAWGAPYQDGTALGVILLGGAERTAISSGRFGESGAWGWSATASLGLRGSLRLGSVDVWAGVDGLVRSHPIETSGPGGVTAPTLSALVSLGGFLPAYSRSLSPTPAAESARGPELDEAGF